MRQHWTNGQRIEVAQRNRFGGVTGPGSTLMHHQADLIFDMVTFQIIKSRIGSCDLTPEQACDTLKKCIEHEDTRILLLVD